jgi:hypothetical protein
MKKIWLFFLLGSVIALNLFAGPASEADIPPPQTYYELPREMIGEFIFPQVIDEINIKIYTSNKYIITTRGSDYLAIRYGHIIKRQDAYYFSPLDRISKFVNEAMPIEIDTDGISFFIIQDKLKVNAYRKINYVIKPEAKQITIQKKESKQQYFVTKDLQDNVVKISCFSIFQNNGRNFLFEIISGEVYIYFPIYKKTDSVWQGILEVEEKRGGQLKGKIIFTNGPAYFFTNGSATIVIDDGGIEIKTGCTVAIEDAIKRNILDYQGGDVELVLDF